MRHRLAAAVAAAVLILEVGTPSFAGTATGAEVSVKYSPTNGTFRECEGCPEMVAIPHGTYAMSEKSATDGRPGGEQWPGDKGALGTDHTVEIKQFALGVHDVTRAEYALFVREEHYKVKPGCYVWRFNTWIEDRTKNWQDPGFQQTPNDPVVCVSKEDASAFVDWLNRRVRAAIQARHPAAGTYRLPTWEEIEYASAGTNATNYYWGDSPSHSYANYGDNECLPCKPARQGRDRWLYTSPVGSFAPNAFGLYDMAGDVWQWTENCWPKMNFRACWLEAAHGGSWLDNPEYLRTASFRLIEPSNRNTTTGFRVARTANDGEN